MKNVFISEIQWFIKLVLIFIIVISLYLLFDSNRSANSKRTLWTAWLISP